MSSFTDVLGPPVKTSITVTDEAAAWETTPSIAPGNGILNANSILLAGAWRWFARFDLTSITSTSTIVSATLNLYGQPTTAPPTAPGYLNAGVVVVNPDYPWKNSDVSWTYYSVANTLSWAFPGGNWLPSPLASSTRLPAGPAEFNWYSWNVKDAVDLRKSLTLPLLMIGIAELGVVASPWSFKTLAEPDSSLWPRLDIVYRDALVEPEEILEEGHRQLESLRDDWTTDLVDYTQDGTTLSINATIGETEFEEENEDGSVTKNIMRDFLVSAADLVTSGRQLTPQPGDVIVEITPAGKRIPHEVISRSQGPPWIWSDPYHLTYRIHTKEIADA